MRGLKLLEVTGVFLASVAGAQIDSRSQDVLAAVHNASGGERISADARYRIAFSDLNDDHQPEAIVYLTDRNLCGSGGCTTFVLTHADGAWHPIGRMTVSQLPIYRLPTHHNGWFDLAVRAGGGGIRPGMRTMSF